MVKLTINGIEAQAHDGATVLETAREMGIRIPTLCYHKDLSPFGGCRLCVVQVKGARNPEAACTRLVQEGMEVETESPRLYQSRKFVLELLLSNYYAKDFAAIDGHQSELMYWAEHFGLDPAKYAMPAPRFAIDSDPNPFIRVDMNRCILCERCIRACDEVQGRFVWGLTKRGFQTEVVAGGGKTLLEARCESCGACVAYCPTGALESKLSYGLGAAEHVVTTTCTYCGVGCTLDLNVKDGKVIRVTSNAEAAVNGMHLCVKGRYGYDFIHHPHRLTRPMVREYLLSGQPRSGAQRGNWVEVDWDTALGIVAEKLGGIRDQHGADSISFLTSAKCTNEENYIMNKLARQVIGTNNIDHCARLCHSSTVAGLATAFGSGAMTNSIDDIADHAQAILIIGSNTTEQHPVFGARIRQAVNKRGAKLIVIDPRAIDITEFATLHLRPRGGTDIALLNGIMHILVEKGCADRAFIDARTENYDEFAANLASFTPENVSAITGVPVEQMVQAAEILADNRPGAVLYAMGVTQHTVGVQNVLTVANLQMLLGNLGMPGGGVNPLRGQNNVQGACDMGGLPNVYTAYQPVTSDEARAKFEQAWGVALSPKIGLPATKSIPMAGTGEVRALYILGENPVVTDPDSSHVRHCLETCEFIVLQEIFPSETSAYADVLLPGVTFAEKEGTFTNTERRVQRVRQAVEPVGEARQDWAIVRDVAQRMLAQGSRKAGEAPFAGWDYNCPENILSEINALTPSYAGITYARLDRGERLQWPVPALDHPGTPILHRERFTRGKGRFSPTVHVEAAERPNHEYPLLLNTGRVLYHWHAGEMTRRAQGLLEVYDHPLAEISLEDAARLDIKNGDGIRIRSRRGQIEVTAWATERVPPGMVYAGFHFPEASVNELTIAALDPVAGIPEYKVCAVQVEKD